MTLYGGQILLFLGYNLFFLGSNELITNPIIVTAVEQSSPEGTSAVWESPSFLFENFQYTPVIEAGIAKFRNQGGEDLAAVLVVVTEVSTENPTGLYPHDYRVCQSIHKASLENISSFTASGGVFFLTKMKRPSILEHAVSLLVRDFGGSFYVDSRLFSEQYPNPRQGKHYTFQIWSPNEASTISIVERLLSKLGESNQLLIENLPPRPLPIAIVQRIQILDDKVLLQIKTDNLIPDLGITVVSWENPNPNPIVQAFNKQTNQGFSSIELPVTSSTTDTQVYINYQGILQDKVLASFNSWGDFTSGWFPFEDKNGSSVGISRGSDSGIFPISGEVEANSSVLSLNVNIVVGGFAGIFLDVLPALQHPADLRNYNALLLRTRLGLGAGPLPLEIKLELNDGNTSSETIFLNQAWESNIISFDRFGDWQDIGTKVERIVLAITRPGNFSLELDRLSFLKIVGAEDLNGDGRVDLDDLNVGVIYWGCKENSCTGDIDGDDSVNVKDFVRIVNMWGSC